LFADLDTVASNRHKADAIRSPTTGRSARRASTGAVTPSSPPSSSSLPQPHLFPLDAPVAASAPTAGLFAGIHSRRGKKNLILSTVSQGQVLLHSLATCSPRSVFFCSATLVSLRRDAGRFPTNLHSPRWKRLALEIICLTLSRRLHRLNNAGRNCATTSRMCAAEESRGYLSARSSTRCILAANCSTASPLGMTLARN
jgi:hypothetical protein